MAAAIGDNSNGGTESDSDTTSSDSGGRVGGGRGERKQPGKHKHALLEDELDRSVKEEGEGVEREKVKETGFVAVARGAVETSRGELEQERGKRGGRGGGRNSRKPTGTGERGGGGIPSPHHLMNGDGRVDGGFDGDTASSGDTCEGGGSSESEKLAKLVASRASLKRRNVYLLKKLYEHCKMKKVNQTLSSNDFDKPLEDALSIRNARTRNKMVLSIVKTKIAEDKAEQLRLEKKSDDQVAEIQKLKGNKENLLNTTQIYAEIVYVGVARAGIEKFEKEYIRGPKTIIGGVTGSVVSDQEHGIDAAIEKYHKKLGLYHDVKTGIEGEERVLKAEMADLERELSEREADATAANDDLIKLEISVGKGIVAPKTGRQLNNKAIDRIINEQNSRMEELKEARLKYIKLKNLVEKKQIQLTEMERVDSGLFLKDFKQLQMDHQTLDSKIEDKRNELTKAQMKMSQCMEIEGRLKLKSSRAQRALSETQLILSETEHRLREEMGKLESLKSRRDEYKLRSVTPVGLEGGGGGGGALSAYPILVEDFDESLKRMEFQQARLSGIRADQVEIDRRIRSNRRRIKILCRQKTGARLDRHLAMVESIASNPTVEGGQATEDLLRPQLNP